MKGNAKRVICLFLAAIIVVTTVGYAPPSFALTAMSNSRMEEALKALASPSEADGIVAEVATPSEAESPGDKATPSEAEKLEDKATPSEAVRKFIQLEPEEIPEYYSQVKNAGKRFWKFEDRNGMIQYRDYGYVDGEAEFPLWYEADQVGSVGDMSSSINLDEEYYSLAPYIYKSVVPGKKAWTDLSWRLFFDSFSIEEYVKKNITGFKNWDSSSYDIWILTGAQDDLGYHFYGVLVNETQEEREPGWYYADETGTVFNVSNMLMASLLETQNIYQYQDIPGGYRQNIPTFKSSVSTSTFELKPSGDSYGSRVKTDEVLSRVNFSSNFVGWSTIRCYNNSFTILDGGNNYVQVNGDPADTIEYLSGGDLYPPYYMLDLTKDYTRNFYGIWCPQNADMYIFSNDEYVNTYDKVKYGINSIIVRRDTSLNIDSIRPASKQGFTFKGWYYRSNYNDIPILPNTELRFGSSANVTWVYPNYERNVNKVEFLDIDGNNLKTDMVLTGEAAIPPQAHEIEGMDFVGWDKSFTNVSQDMVIKAQYKKLPNIIIIYRDAPSSSANILKTETIIAKGKATPPEVDLSSLPTPKTGYHYSGTWYGIPNVDLDCIETFDSKTYYKDSTVYLYPKQEGNMIKVTLHSNDGQDVTKVIDVQYESSLYWSSVIDSQILTKGLVETRTGYTFNGWGTTPEANYSNLNNVQPYDQDLYQIWKPVPYYVIFDKCVSGESSPYKVQVIYDKPIGKLPEVTSKGLDFLGWFTYYYGGTQVTEETLMPNRDFNLYAQWSRYPTKITLDYHYEGAPNPYTYSIYMADYTYYQIYINIADRTPYTRKGYSFKWWNTKPDDTGRIFYKGTNSSYVPESRDITVYAIWEPLNIYIRLYKNTSSSDTSELSLVSRKFDSPVGKLAVPTNGDKIFKGWYTARTGGTLVSENDIVNNYTVNGTSNNWYLYAQWANSQNKVTFKDWDNSVLSEQTIDYGKDAIPPELQERAGYRFVGWDKPYENIQGDTVLTAQYEIISKTLRIVGNGGNLSDQSTIEKTIAPGESLDQILSDEKNTALRKFYTFDGWYTDQTGGSKYPDSGNKMPDTDLVIYAHWTRSSSEVIFKDWDGMTLEKQEVAIGANATPPEVPERQGYTFNGWDKSYSNIQDHSTITAQYTINGYLLTLDGNGGTLAGNARKEQVLSFNQSFDQVLKDGKDLVSRPGYSFDGWYNSASGGSSYSYSGNQMPAANVTLFAHWSPNTYKVTFDPDHVRWDGEATIEEHTFDTRLGILPMPEIYGWKFTGWWTGKNGTGTEVTNDSMVEPKDVVYYGIWQPETYQIRFISKAEQPEGESVQAFTVGLRYDQEFGNLPVPEEKGYTFMGWYDENNKKVDSETIFNPDSDAEARTYHAGWKGKTYQNRFVYNDSDGKPVVKIIDGTYGMQIGMLPSPEKPGYTFAGWFRDNGEEVTAGSWVEPGDTEYKAKWIPNKYTIHFKSNLDAMNDPEDKIVTYALPIGDLALLHATGYVFLGWYTESSGGSLIKETTLAALGDQTYYGHWSIGLIDNGNGTYRKPGSDGKWNTADDELWWYGPDGIIDTDDDKQIYLMPGGNGYYVDYGNGTYLRPGAGGNWISGTELWWYGTNDKPGAGDRPIYLMPGGNGYYVDYGNGSYLKPGSG
ncbi:MAG: hypothetical protein E7250_23365, partial [Paenibacillaceae bacterium]|nr:hypothetical protein [Paenibacillaceae bacterium]